jgi:hypothetical protein
MAITRKFALAGLLLLWVGIFATAASDKKQEPYALIFGTVFDSNSQPVPGVKVKIARLKGDKPSKTWEHISDRRGEFAQRVPAGAADYRVWAEIKREKNQPRSTGPEVKVHIENDERQDIGLHLIP